MQQSVRDLGFLLLLLLLLLRQAVIIRGLINLLGPLPLLMYTLRIRGTETLNARQKACRGIFPAYDWEVRLRLRVFLQQLCLSDPRCSTVEINLPELRVSKPLMNVIRLGFLLRLSSADPYFFSLFSLSFLS